MAENNISKTIEQSVLVHNVEPLQGVITEHVTVRRKKHKVMQVPLQTMHTIYQHISVLTDQTDANFQQYTHHRDPSLTVAVASSVSSTANHIQYGDSMSGYCDINNMSTEETIETNDLINIAEDKDQDKIKQSVASGMPVTTGQLPPASSMFKSDDENSENGEPRDFRDFSAPTQSPWDTFYRSKSPYDAHRFASYKMDHHLQKPYKPSFEFDDYQSRSEQQFTVPRFIHEETIRTYEHKLEMEKHHTEMAQASIEYYQKEKKKYQERCYEFEKEMEHYKVTNVQLEDHIRQYRHEIASLREEHVDMQSILAQGMLKYEELQDEYTTLKNKMASSPVEKRKVDMFDFSSFQEGMTPENKGYSLPKQTNPFLQNFQPESIPTKSKTPIFTGYRKVTFPDFIGKSTQSQETLITHTHDKPIVTAKLTGDSKSAEYRDYSSGQYGQYQAIYGDSQQDQLGQYEARYLGYDASAEKSYPDEYLEQQEHQLTTPKEYGGDQFGHHVTVTTKPYRVEHTEQLASRPRQTSTDPADSQRPPTSQTIEDKQSDNQLLGTSTLQTLGLSKDDDDVPTQVTSDVTKQSGQIRERPLKPEDLKMIDMFSGSESACFDFLNQFHSLMALRPDLTDDQKKTVFTARLKQSALLWYKSVGKDITFDQLLAKFVRRFVSTTTKQSTITTMRNIKYVWGQNLQRYVDEFRKFQIILGYTDEQIVMEISMSLINCPSLKMHVELKKAETLDDIQSHMQEYLVNYEATVSQAPQLQSNYQQTPGGYQQSRGGRGGSRGSGRGRGKGQGRGQGQNRFNRNRSPSSMETLVTSKGDAYVEVNIPGQIPVVVKRGQCAICMAVSHVAHDCRANIKCEFCKGKHMTQHCAQKPTRSYTPEPNAQQSKDQGT